MITMPRVIASLALAAAMAPVGLAGQGEGALAPAQLPPEAQELLAEAQQIQSELAPIQQQAVQNPELAAEQESLAEEIRSVMVDTDPSVAEKMERLQVLMDEARQAREAGDNDRMREVVAEAQIIEQSLKTTQAAALGHPEIAPRVEQFQANLKQAMVELNPEAGALLERAEEIEQRLVALLDGEQ